MTIRTAVLASTSFNAGVTVTLFTVPAGQTWIVKDVLVHNWAAGNNQIRVRMVDPVSLTYLYLIDVPATDPGRKEWQGWMTLVAGQYMDVWSPNNAGYIWVAGSKLSGIAA